MIKQLDSDYIARNNIFIIEIWRCTTRWRWNREVSLY